MLGEFGNVKAVIRIPAGPAFSKQNPSYMTPHSPPGQPCYSSGCNGSSSPPVKAILCQHYGPPDELVLADIPDPVAGPGEVVAKVVACGLNFFDTLIIAGKYQTKPPFPFSPGGELAGVVESVGSGVTEFKPGDRVMGYTNFNAARERTAVPTAQIVKIA